MIEHPNLNNLNILSDTFRLSYKMLLVTHKIDFIDPRVITDPKIFCEPLNFSGFNNSDTYSLMGDGTPFLQL